MSLAEASQRLVDVTARHKRQIEQMAKERVCAFIVSEVVFCFSFKRVCVMFCSVRIIYCHTQVCHFQAVLSVSGCSGVFSSLCRTCAASKLLLWKCVIRVPIVGIEVGIGMLPEHLSGCSSKFHFISGCPSYFLKHLGRFQTLRRTPLCTEKPVYGYCIFL